MLIKHIVVKCTSGLSVIHCHMGLTATAWRRGLAVILVRGWQCKDYLYRLHA